MEQCLQPMSRTSGENHCFEPLSPRSVPPKQTRSCHDAGTTTTSMCSSSPSASLDNTKDLLPPRIRGASRSLSINVCQAQIQQIWGTHCAAVLVHGSKIPHPYPSDNIPCVSEDMQAVGDPRVQSLSFVGNREIHLQDRTARAVVGGDVQLVLTLSDPNRQHLFSCAHEHGGKQRRGSS